MNKHFINFNNEVGKDKKETIFLTNKIKVIKKDFKRFNSLFINVLFSLIKYTNLLSFYSNNIINKSVVMNRFGFLSIKLSFSLICFRLNFVKVGVILRLFGVTLRLFNVTLLLFNLTNLLKRLLTLVRLKLVNKLIKLNFLDKLSILLTLILPFLGNTLIKLSFLDKLSILLRLILVKNLMNHNNIERQ